jgi:hypothetical protein
MKWGPRCFGAHSQILGVCPACTIAVRPSARYLTLAQAQAKAFVVDWKDPINKPIKPKIIGTKAFKGFPIEDVVEYIDWNPFFQVSCKCAVLGKEGGGWDADGCLAALQLGHM